MANNLTSIRQAIGHGRKYFEKIVHNEGTRLVWEKEAGFAMQIIRDNKYLQSCPPETIRAAVVNIAAIGLSLNPAEKLAYLVPRDGKACLDISYRGMVKLAIDGGSIVWAKAVLVYENDTFEFKGVDEKPVHTFDAFAKDRGELIGGYSIAKLTDGTYLVDTMTVAEINEIRDLSKAKNGPWKSHYNEMAKKTLLRRGSKSWPITSKFMQAEAVLNEHQGIEKDPVVTKNVTLLINDEQIKELAELIEKSHVDIKKIYTAFEISSLDDLPADKFELCKKRLIKAAELYEKKHADRQAEESTAG